MEKILKRLRAHRAYRPLPPKPSHVSEQTFKEVLHLWNLCPGAWAAGARANRLGCSKRSFPDLHKFYSNQRKRLTREPLPHTETPSAEFLKEWKAHPLGTKYRDALGAVEWWHKFREDSSFIFSHSALREMRDGLNDDSATRRTGKELIALKSFEHATESGLVNVPLAEFWRLDKPPLGLVELARRRWQEYRDAHAKGGRHLEKIVWPFDYAKVMTPAEARDLVIQSRDAFHIEFDINFIQCCARLARKLAPDDLECLADPKRMAIRLMSDEFKSLSDQDKEETLWRTHRHSHLFRSFWRDALRFSVGLLPKREFCTTMMQIFPQFSLDEKILFVRLSQNSNRPREQLQNRRALLCAWAEFNAPVFKEYRWYRQAVYDAAIAALGPNQLPKNEVAMFEYFNDAKPRVSLGLNTIPPKDEATKAARPYEQLLETPQGLISADV